MRSRRDLVRALPTAVLVLMLCGCSKRPQPEDATLNIYPLMHGSESNRSLSVAIEIRNVSRRPLTFLTPQEGSACGYSAPKYFFGITNDQGRVFPPCTFFWEALETSYDESTVITIAPGESLYVHEEPYGVVGMNRLTMSLTYSCDHMGGSPQWQSKKKRGWPKSLFVGTLQSPVVEADMFLPIPREDPHVIPGENNTRDLSPGKTENGLSVHLYAFRWKYQEWTPGSAWIDIGAEKGRSLQKDPWRLKLHWYDRDGKEVPLYQYSEALCYPGEFPWRVLGRSSDPSCCALPDYPIGFQKKAGSYKVSVDLMLKGKRMATSNFIDIEIIPNPLLAEPKTNAPPGSSAGGR